jgi:hypothetical protein
MDRASLRPCVRWNFSNFLFLRVSETFGCQSLEIFRKKTEFLNSQNFHKKVWILFKNVRQFQKFWKNSKTDSKVWLKVRNAGP